MKRCPHCGYQEPRKLRPRKVKRTYMRNGHEYLVGVLAHTRRRLEIFRAAGGEAIWPDENDPSTVEEVRAAKCQGCVEGHLVGWNDGQWHHNVRSKGGKRCDCAACGLFVCQRWHAAFHNRVVKFSSAMPRAMKEGEK